MKPTEHEAQFQRWLSDHIGVILKVVRTCVESPQDQEDLTQEIMVNLWASIPRFRGESQTITWIYRVSFNTAMAWRRGERRQRQKLKGLQHEATRVATRSGEESRRQELIERMYAAIRRLPQVDASLALMHLDGLSYREMSDVMGMSENYIGVKLNRIRNKLADELQRESDEFR